MAYYAWGEQADDECEIQIREKRGERDEVVRRLS
jgi:hypothetical protein